MMMMMYMYFTSLLIMLIHFRLKITYVTTIHASEGLGANSQGNDIAQEHLQVT